MVKPCEESPVKLTVAVALALPSAPKITGDTVEVTVTPVGGARLKAEPVDGLNNGNVHATLAPAVTARVMVTLPAKFTQILRRSETADLRANSTAALSWSEKPRLLNACVSKIFGITARERMPRSTMTRTSSTKVNPFVRLWRMEMLYIDVNPLRG